MLLKQNNNYNKGFFYDFIFRNNIFLVININDFEKFDLYDFCLNFLKIFHNKSFLNFNIFSNLFSGNNYFCFIELYNFYYYYLKLSNFDDIKFDLLGVCFNNFFLNINFNFFNLSNKIYYNFFLIVYYYNICVFFLFFKFLNFFKNLSFKLVKIVK